MAIKTAAQRAAAGAKFLDEKRPGWAARINLRTLDVDNPERCPVACTTGSNYTEGMYKLGINDPFGVEAVDLGFCDTGDSKQDAVSDLSALNAAWKTEIKQRVAA